MSDIYQEGEDQIIEKQKIVDFDIKEFTIELIVSKYLNRLEEDDNDIFIPTYQRQFAPLAYRLPALYPEPRWRAAVPRDIQSR